MVEEIKVGDLISWGGGIAVIIEDIAFRNGRWCTKIKGMWFSIDWLIARQTKKVA